MCVSFAGGDGGRGGGRDHLGASVGHEVPAVHGLPDVDGVGQQGRQRHHGHVLRRLATPARHRKRAGDSGMSGQTVSRLHFSIVINFPIDVSAHARSNVKSSMCNETTKNCWYYCHRLFANSPVMITVKSCLKLHSDIISPF